MPPPRTSGWAMAAIFCSSALCCPVLTLLGPLIALRALVQTKAAPERFAGRGMAKAAVAIGLIATVIQFVALTWWNRHARQPMIHGPMQEFVAGQRGDWDAVRAGFSGDGALSSDAELKAFFDEVNHRCGRLLEITQRTADPKQAASDSFALRIPYTMKFETGAFDADALFEMRREGRVAFVLRWKWVRIVDPRDGDLVYPSSAQPPPVIPDPSSASAPAASP